KYAAGDGGLRWAQRFGSTGSDAGQAVAMDGSGNVLVTGVFQGTVDFGGGPRASAGGMDIFVAKYAGASGAHMWSVSFGGAQDDFGQGIAVDGAGDVVVVGYFQGTVDLGRGALSSAGGQAVFVARYA